MTDGFERVSVIGLGYVGLPTAAVIADIGPRVRTVAGVDVDAQRVERLMKGEVHFVEPDLDTLLGKSLKSGTFRAVTEPEKADAFVIAVPTPFTHDHQADLTHLEAAARALAPVLEKGNLVLIESTSPVGTTERFAGWLAAERPDLSFPQLNGDPGDVFIAYSPERVLPGNILAELRGNDRVIGGLTPACAERALAFYRLFVDGNCDLTDARTAEMVKLAENAYRDANVAFANEMASVCELLEIDVYHMVELANRHPRVNILNPGPGVGGHCVAVDPWFIVGSAPDRTPLIQTARRVNDQKPAEIVGRIAEMAAARGSRAVACLGLAYKADIDDLRQSPAIEVVRNLARLFEGEILVVEPHIDALPDGLAGEARIRLVATDDALAAADILVLLTDHSAFRAIDEEARAGKGVIDTRGMWR